jgi:hypothetical protein
MRVTTKSSEYIGRGVADPSRCELDPTTTEYVELKWQVVTNSFSTKLVNLLWRRVPMYRSKPGWGTWITEIAVVASFGLELLHSHGHSGAQAF